MSKAYGRSTCTWLLILRIAALAEISGLLSFNGRRCWKERPCDLIICQIDQTRL